MGGGESKSLHDHAGQQVDGHAGGAVRAAVQTPAISQAKEEQAVYHAEKGVGESPKQKAGTLKPLRTEADNASPRAGRESEVKPFSPLAPRSPKLVAFGGPSPLSSPQAILPKDLPDDEDELDADIAGESVDEVGPLSPLSKSDRVLLPRISVPLSPKSADYAPGQSPRIPGVSLPPVHASPRSPCMTTAVSLETPSSPPPRTLPGLHLGNSHAPASPSVPLTSPSASSDAASLSARGGPASPLGDMRRDSSRPSPDRLTLIGREGIGMHPAKPLAPIETPAWLLRDDDSLPDPERDWGITSPLTSAARLLGLPSPREAAVSPPTAGSAPHTPRTPRTPRSTFVPHKGIVLDKKDEDLMEMIISTAREEEEGRAKVPGGVAKE
eukprot:jgi/Mesvir1/26575/Mv16229-RA.1